MKRLLPLAFLAALLLTQSCSSSKGGGSAAKNGSSSSGSEKVATFTSDKIEAVTPTDGESSNSNNDDAQKISDAQVLEQERLNQEAAAAAEAEAAALAESQAAASVAPKALTVEAAPAPVPAVAVALIPATAEAKPNVATAASHPERTKDIFTILPKAAAQALQDLEEEIGFQLGDNLIYHWGNAVAYDSSKIKVLKTPAQVKSDKDSTYYYGATPSLKSPFMKMTPDQELAFSGCKGVFYVEGPTPENQRVMMKGYAIKINDRFYGIWSHCGWAGEILKHFETAEEIERLATEGK